MIEAVVSTGLPGQGNLLILGVDMTGDRSLREYDLESGDGGHRSTIRWCFSPSRIRSSSPTPSRARTSWRSEAKVPMSTMEGQKHFTVRGIMKSGGLTSAFGGNLAIMDIYAAQKVFGRGRRFDRIDLAVKDGAQRGGCTGEAGSAARFGLPGGIAVGARPAVRIHLANLRADGEHHQRIRALHRDVHHLQHVPDCGHAAAPGDRDSARARGNARARSGPCFWARAWSPDCWDPASGCCSES